MAGRVLTLFDACVIIAGADATQFRHEEALQALAAPACRIVASELLVIETVAASMRRGNLEQAAFVRDLLETSDHWVPIDDQLLREAAELASIPGGPRSLDAIHLACARRAGAVFVTMDRRLLRNRVIPGVSVSPL